MDFKSESSVLQEWLFLLLPISLFLMLEARYLSYSGDLVKNWKWGCLVYYQTVSCIREEFQISLDYANAITAVSAFSIAFILFG